MVNYKNSGERAKETATFRFTSYEKQLLAHLANLQNMTQTALIRTLLAERADALDIQSLPAPEPRRKPGRPKKNRHEEDNVSLESASVDNGDDSARVFNDDQVSKGTFGFLIVRFQEYFKMRSEKMQRELETTVRFVTGVGGTEALLASDLPLVFIDSTMLSSVRMRIQDADIRFPQKNLHLTYLRMMFNFGVKEEMLPATVQPVEVFRSFTAKEVADAFPLPIKTI